MTVPHTQVAALDKLAVDTTAVFSWNVNYAAAVHNGARLKSGGTLKARPWVTVALREFDFQGTFAKLLIEYGGDSDRAFRETCELLGVKFRTLITSAVWQWGGLTRRKDGTTAGTTRDIVDTGRLRDSQHLDFL
ncbi:MAG: hypothetical protein RBJ76_13755 [Stenomitos frigidus ULC029]